MRRPRVTVNATMLASAIRIDAVLESDVGAVVVRDDRARRVAKEFRRWRDRQLVRIEIVELRFEVDRLESIRRIARRAAAMNGKGNTHQFPQRSLEFQP